MGGRYVVTGTELGMLIALDSQEKRQAMVDNIIEEAHICNDVPKEEIIKVIQNILNMR